MVEIGKKNRSAQTLQLVRGDAFDRTPGADRHECRGGDLSVRGYQASTTRGAVAGKDLELATHGITWGKGSDRIGRRTPRRPQSRTHPSSGRPRSVRGPRCAGGRLPPPSRSQPATA